ncbi:MAG: MotA/TolQ/ExbB proton channel family protein [Phycisphaeraceae bacterium]|nr:MotA/TolQ/ExbB proton channel family protein [Phycisphaeraceae bacterium]
MSKRKNFVLSLWAAALAIAFCLMQVAPVLAQEEAAEHKPKGFFQKFMMVADEQGIEFIGTAVIWACFLISIVIISLIIQAALKTRKAVYTPGTLVDTLDRLIAEKNFKEAIEVANSDPSPFGHIMRHALAEAPRGYPAMEAAIEETADNINNRRVRSFVWLELAGAAGPMIGLFGTVYGMIVSFNKLVEAGGTPKASALAGGIATALVCTFWGLIVGIPGVITASLFRVMTEGRTAEAIAAAKQLIAPFRPGAGKSSKPSTPAPSAAPATPKPVTAT